MKMSTFIIYYFVSCSLIYKLSLLFVRGFYCTKSCNVKTGMFYLLLPSLMPFLCLSWLLLLILPILLCRSGGSEHLCSGPDLIGNTFSFSPFSILVMGLLCRKKKLWKKHILNVAWMNIWILFLIWNHLIYFQSVCKKYVILIPYIIVCVLKGKIKMNLFLIVH